jgi:hypothetical protein
VLIVCNKTGGTIKGDIKKKFDRLVDKNEIKVRYGPLAEIWNKFVGFQSLLEANDDALDHEADWAEYGEFVGITGGRVLVGNTKL